MQLPSGYNVKTASPLGQMIQDGQMSIGLYGETQSVRDRAKPLVQLPAGVIDCRAAIDVRWRAKFLRHGIQRHSLAHHFFAARTACSALLPLKMRRERSGIHVF